MVTVREPTESTEQPTGNKLSILLNNLRDAIEEEQGYEVEIKCFDDLKNYLDKFIWHSKEVSPERDGRYIISTKGIHDGIRDFELAFYENGKWDPRWRYLIEAWMEEPEPYKPTLATLDEVK